MVVCLAIVACGGSGAQPRRAGQQVLEAIRIEGNKAIESDTLIAGLILHRRLEGGRGVDEYQLQTDTARIIGAYQKLGYFAVDVHARVDHHGDTEVVVFTVVEGPRAAMRVEIVGLPDDVPLAKARALVHVDEGAPFDYAEYDAGKSRLLEAVEEAGYAYARLDASVIADAAHRIAIARYIFDPGPRCTFGPVSIAGADGALAEAIRVRLAVHEGALYSPAAIADSEKALYDMGRFSTVRVDFDRDKLDPVIMVRVGVAEGTHHSFLAGGGLGFDPVNYQARGRATYTQVGWPFALSTVTVDAKPAVTWQRGVSCCTFEPRARLIGSLSQLDFLVPHWSGEVEGGLDFLTLEAYTTQGARGRIGLAMELWPRIVQARIGWMVAGYKFLQVNLDPATAHAIGLDHFERIGALTQTLTVDLRDRVPEPRFGGYAGVRLVEGQSWLGSAYNYFQITPELRGFVPLGELVFAGRVRLGRIYGDVPPTERYYSGGVAGNRGFPERQLSPAGSNLQHTSLVVIGGASLIETSGEMRVPIAKGFGAVVFVDGGDVEMTVGGLSTDNIHMAVGIGLRYVGFLVPVGVDIAYRWNHDDPAIPPQPRFPQWNINVGEAF